MGLLAPAIGFGAIGQQACIVVLAVHPLPEARCQAARIHGGSIARWLRCPPLVGWIAVTQQAALAYAASIMVGLAGHYGERADLVRSPTCVLTH